MYVLASYHPEGHISYINNLFTMSLFMRMHGHFLRLLFAVRRAVQEQLQIIAQPPPPGAVAFADETIQFFMLLQEDTHEFVNCSIWSVREGRLK